LSAGRTHRRGCHRRCHGACVCRPADACRSGAGGV
ncbi:hypothetical protein AK812_SmicGene48318, partial [Symbiodinium microadriaticum]